MGHCMYCVDIISYVLNHTTATLTLSQTSRFLHVWNTVGKGEIARRRVFYLFGGISAIFITSEIVVCKLFQFGRVWNLSFGKGLNHTIPTLNNPKGEGICIYYWKRRNVAYQYFLLFLQFFPLSKTTSTILNMFILLSATAFGSQILKILPLNVQALGDKYQSKKATHPNCVRFP